MDRTTRIIVIGLVIIGFALYAFNLNNALFWDDDDWIINNPAVHTVSLENLKFLFSHDILAGIGQSSNYFRPVLSLSFAFNWIIGGDAPFGYHLVSNLLHIASAVLLFFLLRVLLRISGFKARFSEATAGMAAFFWLIHPLNTEAVTYISGRGDPLSLFLMLLAIIAWLMASEKWPVPPKSSDHGGPDRSPVHSNVLKAGALAAAVLAILSRETALLLPGYLVLIGVTFLYREPFWRSLRRSLAWASPFIAVSAGYWLMRLTVLNFENTLNWHRLSNAYSESVLIRTWTFLGALFDYMRLAVMPIGLHMERSVPVLTSPLAWPVPLVSTLFVLVAWLVIRSWKRGNRLPLFGTGWFLLALAPASGIAVPINALIYEHWLYVPLIGLAVVGGFYAMRLYAWVRSRSRVITVLFLVCAVCYALFLAVQTVRRNIIWGDTERFYVQILSYEPANVRVLNNLANWYADDGQVGLAETYWLRAVESDPTQPAPYHNLGNLARDRGDIEEAEELYRQAIANDESFHYAYRNLTVLLLDQKRLEEAQGLLLKLIELTPGDARNYYVLAQIYDAVGRGDLASQILKAGARYVRTQEEAKAFEQLYQKVKAE